MKFLHLNFIPRSADVALLVLRVWFGLSMLLLHGWGKLTNFSTFQERFVNFLGLGPTVSLVLAIIGELVCPALIALGLFTRFAALLSAITMAVAFSLGHGAKLTGPSSGEMAFLYLGVFVTIFVAGAGKHSIDANIGAKG